MSEEKEAIMTAKRRKLFYGTYYKRKKISITPGYYAGKDERKEIHRKEKG